MSWWVYLRYPDSEECCEVDRHSEGGTYVFGGTPTAELNITYNYSPFYYWFIDSEHGLRFLDGKQASEVVDVLAAAVDKLGTKPWKREVDGTVQHDSRGFIIRGPDMVEDYWAPTPGNAGRALSTLLDWAKQHPQAIFSVS